jgi:anaerobic magnesium-protoporphyrin IX monomethyl ester cyclase|tara:strand:- start:3026 stop:4591 length:1566 start_codon:yes stop_codon:yes gene_type:complete
MAKVLLINPSYDASYGGTKVKVVNPIYPTLGLSTIAATALQKGHKVEILDLSWRPYDFELIRNRVLQTKPDIVGITATTPFMNQLRDISVLIKDISKNILVIGGGPHPSALPEETLHETMLDAVLIGEADYSFCDICDGYPLSDILGIFYRDDDQIFSTKQRPLITNLDELPMPAWHLYNITDYHKISRLLCKRLPMTTAEFSRGCVYRCDFCASKITMSLGYRKKSPERCAEEVQHLYDLGYREFMLADDIFTSDQKWAKQVCDAIYRKNVDIVWTCTNGIRVESADDSLFKSLKQSKCYRVSFGFESGNDEVLKAFGKGGRATVEQARKAVKMARDAGIDSNGYFMVGLSTDTEKTMQETIEFARTIPVDMIKCSICIAFPGTKMFNDYIDKGLVRSFDWDEYMIYTAKNLFTHENLSFDVIQRYMKKFFIRCILFNPSFIIRRIIRGIRTGEFFWDAYYAIKFYLLPTTGNETKSNYYAKERWPQYDFKNRPPKPAHYQIARKSQPKVKKKLNIEMQR